ncbi:DUF1700 domain-containing protein [Bariatricus sp. SGI.154]|uniref:DUF1700 domain-containing protein n=1 Tax=Bariatricus sp. SGI.154 TaxID=3420549 RepID=UPI003D04F366
MNRIEFMTELAALLQDVPVEERVEAMQYYNDYFDDAGEENEQQVILELGSPKKVAATIKADLANQEEQGEYTENGYTDTRFEKKDMPADRSAYRSESQERRSQESSGQESGYQKSGYRGGGYRDGGYQNGEYQGHGYASDGEQPKSNKTLKVALIVILIIVASPIVLPILLGIAAVVFGMIMVAAVLFVSLVIASVAVVFAGVCVFISGLVSLIPEIAVGLALIGTGLILTVIGVIATVASVKLCIVVFPGICRGIVWICRWPFQRRAVA